MPAKTVYRTPATHGPAVLALGQTSCPLSPHQPACKASAAMPTGCPSILAASPQTGKGWTRPTAAYGQTQRGRRAGWHLSTSGGGTSNTASPELIKTCGVLGPSPDHLLGSLGGPSAPCVKKACWASPSCSHLRGTGFKGKLGPTLPQWLPSWVTLGRTLTLLTPQLSHLKAGINETFLMRKQVKQEKR